MTRTLPLDVLDDLRVASPCPMAWERMVGDEKRRFCEHCGRHVHNLAAMTRGEALELVEEASRGGRVCARFYRRADGTILMHDCPVGVAAARARLARACGRIAAALGLVLSGVWVFGRGEAGSETRLADRQPFATLREWMYPASLMPARPPVLIAGEICPPPPRPAPGTGSGASGEF